MGGQASQAGVSSPPGAHCPEAASPPGGKLPRVGGKIPWGIFTPGGQAAQRQLHPRGGKLPRVQDKSVHRHRLKGNTTLKGIVLYSKEI